MTFAHPLWFCGLALLPLLVLAQARSEVQRARLVRQLVAPRLQARLASTASPARRWLRLALLLFGFAALFATLAQPRWGFQTVETKARGRDIIIAIDTSRSMLANDLTPSRLARVKLAAEDLVGELKGDRVGLVAFAGSAFLQAPLTADSSAILASLHELDTDIIPLGGTNIAEAIHTAVDAFGKGESDERAIVLFTDGEELDADGVAAAKELKGKTRIFTVGAGSPDGSIIALPGRNGLEYVKDADGQIVKSRLDEERLRAIAEATGGFYLRLTSGPAEMKQILRDGLLPMSAHDSTNQTSRRPIERYQWPLSAALLLLTGSIFVGERRRTARIVGSMVTLWAWLALTPGAAAKSEGLAAYEKEDYNGAVQRFEEELKEHPKKDEVQFDVGAAAYKAGQLEKALGAFSNAIRTTDPSLRTKSEYNLGNTLFQRGSLQKERPPKIQDWKNSLQHYEEALKTDAHNENAIYNRDVVRKLLEEEQKEEKKDEEKKKEEEQKKQDQKKGGSKDKKKDQGQKGDQPKPDQKEGDQGDQKSDSKPQNGKGEQPDQKHGDQQDQQGQPKSGGDDPHAQPNREPGKKEGEQPESNQREAEQAPKKRTGQVEGTSKGDSEQQKREAEAAQAAEEAQAAAEGKMTEAQARSLLDSLRSEDDRVRLLNPRTRRPPEGSFRDW